MALKNFIKDNFVLVVGLTLPVLLVAAFVVAAVLPKSMAVPPQYEMLFSVNHPDYQTPPPYNVDFIVKGNTLTARVYQNGTPPPPQNFNWKKLMAYDGKTQSVREIPYDLSKLGDLPNGAEVILDEVKNMKVDSATVAPDGYQFNNTGYGSHGLVADLFGGSSRNNAPRVVKGAAAFKIPAHNGPQYYPYDMQFIGWVVGKE